jgi:hypothetical protein
MATFTLHFAKPISLLTLLIAIISVILVFKVKIDFNPINLRDPNTESVIAFKNLNKDPDTTPMTLTVLANGEQQAKAMQQKLTKLSTVDKTVSLFDFKPSEQEEKLAIIEEISMLLGSQLKYFPALKDDNDPIPGINRLIKTINTVLPDKTDGHEISALKDFREELQDILIEIDARQQPSRRMFIEKIQTTLLGTLPSTMNELLVGLNAEEVSLNDLPSDFKDRWLSKDGNYRIQIFPKKDLNNLDDLEKFIADVQSVAPETTDLPIIYWESMKEVVHSFQKAITIALVLLPYFYMGYVEISRILYW